LDTLISKYNEKNMQMTNYTYLVYLFAISALTLLVGGMKGIQPVKAE